METEATEAAGGTEEEMEWEGWEVGRVDSDEVKDKQEGDVLYPLGVRRGGGEGLPHRVLR